MTNQLDRLTRELRVAMKNQDVLNQRLSGTLLPQDREACLAALKQEQAAIAAVKATIRREKQRKNP